MANTSPWENPSDAELIARASQSGFELLQYESDTGQVIFEWRQGGHDPGPMFVSRRVALHWMADWLRRESPAWRVESLAAEPSSASPSVV